MPGTSTISSIIGRTYRSAPAVLVTPRSADDHRVRMSAMRSIRIPLNSRKHPGHYALIDERDAELVAPFPWRILKRGNRSYAMSHTPIGEGRYRAVQMHRLIMDAPVGTDVDHINGDGLDNRRENLRFCNDSLNAANRAIRPGGSSRYRGVAWHARCGKWQASIKVHDKNHYLGVFQSEEAAAYAYDNAAREYFGEFARLNFPREGEQPA